RHRDLDSFAEKETMLEAILIAGANGAGKTTFARQFLHVQHPQATFLNADEIQREAKAFEHPVAAARELLERLAILERSRASFAVETTLSSQMYVKRLRKWSRLGYRTTLHFIEVPSAEFAIQRVAQRVAAGGHSIPPEDIRRRYARGLALFESTYKRLPSRWYHWYADDKGLRFAHQR
ncbi:MAG: AAA family ATPase, partial [Acidobacteriota bacterium]